MRTSTMQRGGRLALVALVLACATPATAEPLSSTDQELALRFQAEMQRLQSFGPQAAEYAKELQKQYDAYRRDAQVKEAVRQETQERINQAREAFDRYYQQLVAEGQAEGAERMKKLFEISLMGAPLAVAEPAAAAPASAPDTTQAAPPLTPQAPALPRTAPTLPR